MEGCKYRHLPMSPSSNLLTLAFRRLPGVNPILTSSCISHSSSFRNSMDFEVTDTFSSLSRSIGFRHMVTAGLSESYHQKLKVVCDWYYNPQNKEREEYFIRYACSFIYPISFNIHNNHMK